MARTVREQLAAYRRHVGAQVLQRVWRGSSYRRKQGVFQRREIPDDMTSSKPFYVKGSDINAELDMYHGPVDAPALNNPASASPARSEPLPRKGGSPNRSGAWQRGFVLHVRCWHSYLCSLAYLRRRWPCVDFFMTVVVYFLAILADFSVLMLLLCFWLW